MIEIGGRSFRMLSTINPSFQKVPLILSNDDINVPGKFVQYLHPLQRDGIRCIYNQFRKDNGGVILNDDSGLGKVLETVLFLSAIHKKPDSLPSLILCPKIRINVWKFHLHVWTDGNSGVTIATEEDIAKAVKQKWCTIVIDNLKPRNIALPLHHLRTQFKIWIWNDNLLENLGLLHTIGILLGLINPDRTIEMFLEKFSYINKPYNEAIISFELLNVFCERWLLRSGQDVSNFISHTIYKKYFLEWCKVNGDCNGIDENDSIANPQKLSLDEINQTTSPNKLDSTVKKRGSKDITGLKIKRSKATAQKPTNGSIGDGNIKVEKNKVTDENDDSNPFVFDNGDSEKVDDKEKVSLSIEKAKSSNCTNKNINSEMSEKSSPPKRRFTEFLYD